MKVRLNITVEVDPESWTMNFGVEGTQAIRQDVDAFVRSMLAEASVPMVPVR